MELAGDTGQVQLPEFGAEYMPFIAPKNVEPVLHVDVGLE